MKTENFSCEICGRKFGEEKSLRQHVQAKHSQEKKEFRQKKSSAGAKKMAFYIIIGLALGGIAYVFFLATQVAPTGIGTVGEIHIHAPFSLIINGEEFDFDQPRFTGDGHNKATHFHSGSGDSKRIHVHARGVTIAYFLKTVGIKIESNCMEFNNASYCSNGKKLKLLINGKEASEQEFLHYKLEKDGETASIVFG